MATKTETTATATEVEADLDDFEPVPPARVEFFGLNGYAVVVDRFVVSPQYRTREAAQFDADARNAR